MTHPPPPSVEGEELQNTEIDCSNKVNGSRTADTEGDLGVGADSAEIRDDVAEANTTAGPARDGSEQLPPTAVPTEATSSPNPKPARLPDFRSILQSDEGPVGGTSANAVNLAMPSNAGNGFGATEIPGSSPSAPIAQLQPSGIPGPVAGSVSPEISLSPQPANPGSDAANAMGPMGNVGGGNAGGGRRMRPPDFRSILQSDDGPASGAGANAATTSDPQFVGGAGGIQLGSNNPLAPIGQLQSSNQATGLVAGGAISASAPNLVNPSAEAIGAAGPSGNLGGGPGGGRRMRPPDFRSILQSDEGPVGGTSANAVNLAMPSNAGNGFGATEIPGSSPSAPIAQLQPSGIPGPVAGSVSPEISLSPQPANPGSDAANAMGPMGNVGGGNAGGGRRMRPPDFRSILQSDDGPASGAGANAATTSDPQFVGGAGGIQLGSNNPLAPIGQLQSSNQATGLVAGGAISASAPNLVNPSAEAIGAAGPSGNLGGGPGGGRRMRPPDFRSILQSDEGPVGGTSANAVNLAMPSNAGNGFGATEIPGSSPSAPIAQLQPSGIPGPVAGSVSPEISLSPQPANPGSDAANAMGPMGNVGGGNAGGGRRMRPPDFRSILQSDDGPADGFGPHGSGGVAPDFSLNARVDAAAAFGNPTFQADVTAGFKLQDEPPKPKVSNDPYGLDDAAGGYAHASASGCPSIWSPTHVL